MWQPIETLPDGKVAILYQPANDFNPPLMIIGEVTRGSNYISVYPAAVGGYEWECDVSAPTYWMELPEAPQ